MDQNENFILGRGEKLTGAIELASAPVDKEAPYTIDEAESRLTPQFDEVVRKIEELPELTCPGNQTVVALTLHPEYIAKSYYPEQLLAQFNVEPVGSKATVIKPKKWAKQTAPQSVRSVTLFVRGTREDFRDISSKLHSSQRFGKATEELIKIEEAKLITDIDRTKALHSGAAKVRLEIVLHASANPEDGFIVEGFGNYAKSLGLNVNLNRRLYADGLCFLSMDAPRKLVPQIEAFSFIRVVREMPQLRPIPRASNTSFKIKLPNTGPIDPSIRVAVFDGGIPARTIIDPWVRRHDTPGVGTAPQPYLRHGTAVTGALLFGPLSEDRPPEKPYCFVDHYRVLDSRTGFGDEDLLDVVKRIQDVLESTNYNFVNLSIGPNMPIEDSDEPHVWSAILDQIFIERGILAAVAVGNNGEQDKNSGNARIQPPSDCVNALSVGAADRQAEDWKRAAYSALGPGKAPGIIKPDIVAFGGSSKEPFNLVNAFGGNDSYSDAGTSFASPAALRTALGIRVHFGEVLTPIALKALLIHGADSNGHDRTEVGWGRVPTEFRSIVTTPGNSVRVLYQGVLSPAETIKAPIPIPHGQLKGKVEIKASICFLAPTSPQDSANYTSAGLDVVFRPHDGKKKDPKSRHPDSQSFFSKGEYELYDDPLTYKAHIWETTRNATVTKLASKLKEPCFNLHYNARDGVDGASKTAPQIRYAMVVTVTSSQHKDFYNQVVNRYRAVLEPLKPIIQIPIRTN